MPYNVTIHCAVDLVAMLIQLKWC